MLAALKNEVDKLHSLLADPQPGLATWCGFVGERWKKIADLWGAVVAPRGHECNERGPDGYYCTKLEGHAGEHVAVADVWPAG
jgi:hypothetical protein